MNTLVIRLGYYEENNAPTQKTMRYTQPTTPKNNSSPNLPQHAQNSTL